MSLHFVRALVGVGPKVVRFGFGPKVVRFWCESGSVLMCCMLHSKITSPVLVESCPAWVREWSGVAKKNGFVQKVVRFWSESGSVLVRK